MSAAPLHLLTTRLQRLSWRRWSVRALAGALVVATLTVLTLLLWSVIDWAWEPAREVRGVALAAMATLLAWAGMTWLLPVWRQRESVEQMALWVEREHGIDSDLVAALQFQRTLPTFGSAQLTQAVIDYVSEFVPSLDVTRGFSWQPLPRRLAQFGTLVVLVLLLGLLAPQHLMVFWNRLLLGNERYPTQTVIEEVRLNEVVTWRRGEAGAAITSLQLPANEPLVIAVQTSGVAASEAVARFRAAVDSTTAEWALATTSNTPAGNTTVGDSPVGKSNLQRWTAEIAQLPGSGALTLQVGDDYSEPLRIELLPLPVVELAWEVTPPAYAPQRSVETLPVGARQISVWEGSRLTLRLACLNQPLTRAAVTLNQVAYPLESVPTAEGRQWVLPAGSPLDNVRERLDYRLDVAGAHELRPEGELSGQIRLQADRGPRVAAASISRRVLPRAQPRLSFGATDDLGLRRLQVAVEVRRTDGTSTRDERTIQQFEGSPRPTTCRDEYQLSLDQYHLAKGDEVMVSIIADDERGDLPSQVGRSEPLIFEVTDRNGILAGLLEADQQSARQLDAIIQRELGIGGGSK